MDTEYFKRRIISLFAAHWERIGTHVDSESFKESIRKMKCGDLDGADPFIAAAMARYDTLHAALMHRVTAHVMTSRGKPMDVRNIQLHQGYVMSTVLLCCDDV